MRKHSTHMENLSSLEAYNRAHTFLKLLHKHDAELTVQQMRTLKGQALAGDVLGARRGLEKLLKEKGWGL